MKKLFIPLILLTIVSIAYCVLNYINSPEHALKETINDVKKNGVYGLYPHLTNDAQEIIEPILTFTQNEIFDHVVEFINQDDNLNTLISKVKDTQYGIKDILKGRDNAEVIISFNYNDQLIGTINLSMIKFEGEWKISGIEFPRFSKIDFDNKN